MGKPTPPTPKWYESVLILGASPFLAAWGIQKATETFVNDYTGRGKMHLPSISVGNHVEELRRRRVRRKLRRKTSIKRTDLGWFADFFSMACSRNEHATVQVGDYHANELVESLEKHLYSTIGMNIPAKQNLASVLLSASAPEPRRLCSDVGSKAKVSFEDAGFDYDIILRRLIDNKTAGRYFNDNLRKAWAYLGTAASKMGMRSSNLLAACLMRETEIVEAMARSGSRYSLLGKVSIAEQNDRGRITQRMPIIVVPGAETMPEISKWELNHRKDYFCE